MVAAPPWHLRGHHLSSALGHGSARFQSLQVTTGCPHGQRHGTARGAEPALASCADAGSLGLPSLKNKRVSKELSKEDLSWPLTLSEAQEVSVEVCTEAAVGSRCPWAATHWGQLVLAVRS